ncbi:hypothetical protein CTM76_09240 [Photobacterium phosphoreum]|uniref:hypothetical protein n=1 Tax=Photobacterium phosphoreum TaxID=659 RepID=UPI0007F87E6D|nr:hypothetical protein [Photobacterium phosphoreum]MCD9474344.1 hypothetical protein [Photobacterium phosphoreum]MCD9479236.1 hypothetical protein [Photobacterium phosphoreum]MCD9481882.1 hypothetical protein [Photobacterium phosphoreum]MCD9511656.1 hypothetical protein [Photobacterium phosphoreum]MCD9517706.1 hypothetical protein [Photobacterium phosphoreum]
MNKDRIIRGIVFYTLAAIVFFSALEAAKFVYLLGSSKELYPISIFIFSLGYSTLLLLVSYSLGQKLLFEGSRSNKLFTIKRHSMMPLYMLSLFAGLSVINIIVLSEFSSGTLISSSLTHLCSLSLQYGVTTFIVTLIILTVVMLVNNLIVDRVKTA